MGEKSSKCSFPKRIIIDGQEIFDQRKIETSDIFFTPLKYIFNLLLQQGIFPENLKIAKVSPIYKKDWFLLTN